MPNPEDVAAKDRRVVLFSDVDMRETLAERTSYVPLGPLAIATVLEARGHQVEIIDGQVEPAWRERLASALDGAKLLGLSCVTGPSIRSVLDAIGIARRTAPHVPIVWGGYHATQAYESIFDEELVDFVIRGSGEVAIIELLASLEIEDDGVRLDALHAVPNLAFRVDGQTIANPIQPLDDMAALPPLNYGLIDLVRYLGGDRGDEIDFVSSYGCPHACTFCAEPEQSQRRWRGLPADRVVSELLALRARYGVSRFTFSDPNFSSSPARVAAIVDALERSGADLDLYVTMRARDVCVLANQIDVARLAPAGIRRVFLGLESGSDRMLRVIRKGSTAADAFQACETLSGVGLRLFASFIHDLPGETEADSVETFDLIERLCSLSGLRLSHHFYCPYPMTELFNSLARQHAGALDTSLMRQEDWSRTSTYWSTTFWPGRPAFQRRVLRRLLELNRRYPDVIEATRLPITSAITKLGRDVRERSVSPVELSGR